MRSFALFALALTGVGCSTPYMRHPRFDAQYREAVAVAVLTSRLNPVPIDPAGPPDPERDPDAAVALAIQDELERRRFEVSWVQGTPQTDAAVTDLWGRIDTLLPRLVESYAPPGAEGARPSTFSATLGDVGPILDAFDSDLLLVVVAWGRPGQTTPLLPQLVGLLIQTALGVTSTPQPDVPAESCIRALLVDRTGEVIFFASVEGSSDVHVPSEARGLVHKVLEPLPMR